LNAIEPWSVPPKNKTVRFTLPPEDIPEDTDTSDDEEAPEPEQYNKAVEVAPSIVNSTSQSVTEGRERTPLPDSTSAKRYSLTSLSDPSTPISPSVATNVNAVHNVPRGSTKKMRARPFTAQGRMCRFTPLGFRSPTLRRSSIFYSLDLSEDTTNGVVETKEHAPVVKDAGGSKQEADRVGTSPVQGRGSTKGMRARPSTAQGRLRRFTPLGLRPSMSRRTSIFYSFELFEDTMDGVVATNASKVSGSTQATKKIEQKLPTIERPQKRALAVNNTRDSKRVANEVGTSLMQGKDTVMVANDVKKAPMSLGNRSAKVAAGSPHPVRIALASSSSSNMNVSSPVSPSKTATKKCKKEKATLASVAAMTGSKQKRPARTKTLSAVPSSSISSSSSSPVNVTAAGIMAQKEKLPSRRPPEVAEPGPLSDLKAYVIPSGMNNRLLRVIRERVVRLKGSWLGPETMETDPQAVQEVPALDQAATTHIVTALNSLEAVKQFFGIDEID
ncbi:hypothetical protein BGZ50_000383, partial [Haplosporangium sp. Z 11]